MKPDVTVRTARLEDMKSVYPLAQEMATSFEVQENSFKDSYEEILSEECSVCLVAEKERKVIGYLIGFDHKAFYANGRVSWVEEIFVTPENRNEDIGRELMNSFEGWCVERNSRLIGLATRRASEFYKALDYEESATFFRKIIPQQAAGGDATR